jgi:hypothetical protein
MTPRYKQSKRFANPSALAIVDILFAVFWISAFAAQASYNSSEKCKGACGASKAIVGMGVFIWCVGPASSRRVCFFHRREGKSNTENRLFWCLTALISVYGLLYYRREGYLPGFSRAPFNAQMIDPDKEAFSTAPHDDEYARIQNAEEHEIPDHAEGSGYGAGPSSMGSRYDVPSYTGGGYVPPQVHDEPTGYTGYSGSAPVNTAAGGRVQFPDAMY